MAVALAAGWAFFYLQSGAGDLVAVDNARAAASELRAIDSRWQDQLAAHRRGGGSFEPAAFGKLYGELEVRALHLPYPGMGRSLTGVKNAFEEKSVAMRRVARGEPLVEQAWLAPTGPRLDALGRVLDRAFDDALLTAEINRSWLLYYTGFLVVVMLYVLYRIRETRVPAAMVPAAR